MTRSPGTGSDEVDSGGIARSIPFQQQMLTGAGRVPFTSVATSRTLMSYTVTLVIPACGIDKFTRTLLLNGLG
ncbi:MAG: hypothetical protein IPP40_17580 [bacterium]|nr:hypothetical protein [bacterium]